MSNLVPKLVTDALDQRELLIFTGAGVSLPYAGRPGLPSGRETTSILARKLLDREPTADESLMAVAQQTVWNDYGSRQRLDATLSEIFNNPRIAPLPAHQAIAAIGVTTITTNYDKLTEHAFNGLGKRLSIVWKDDHLPGMFDPMLIKIHGTIDEPSSCIVTEDDYYHWLNREPELRDLVRALLLTKTVCFVGYSLADPNFRAMLRILRFKFGMTKRPGVVIAKEANQQSYDQRFITESLGLTIVQADATDFLRTIASHGNRSSYVEVGKSNDLRERYFTAAQPISFVEFTAREISAQIRNNVPEKLTFGQETLRCIRAIGKLDELPQMNPPYDVDDNMVLIPAGPFIAGGERHGNELLRLEHISNSYRIGLYTVTNAEYREFVSWIDQELHDKTYCHPDEPSNKNHHAPRHQENPHDVPDDYWENEFFSDYPVVNVDWWDAFAYCRWRNGRLPTSLEWERAARGVDGRVYPWGDTFEIRFCNTEEYNRRRPIPVADLASGRSPSGPVNMSGNVWEWCNDEYLEPGHYASAARIVRGGSFSRSEHRARCAFRNGRPPNDYWCSRGFRLARDV